MNERDPLCTCDLEPDFRYEKRTAGNPNDPLPGRFPLAIFCVLDAEQEILCVVVKEEYANTIVYALNKAVAPGALRVCSVHSDGIQPIPGHDPLQ